MDEQEYLAQDFDPATLTVPRLRSILVAHSINYPSSAKKGQLVDLFNEHVAPQARKLRQESMRVKRTSRGIVDVPSQTGSSAYDDDEVAVAHSTRSSGGGRRSTTRARTEEAQEVLPTPKGMRHSTAPPESAAPVRRASNKHARTSSVGEEPEPKRPASRGKSRLSAQTPSVVKREQRLEDDDSPFSTDNVFQSGSSPPQEDRRRTTMSAAKDVDRRRSQSRRKTEEVKPILKEPQRDGVVVPSRKSFEVPVTSTALKTRVKDEIQPTEEFTPDGQLEVELADEADEARAVVPVRTKKKISTTTQLGIGSIFTALLGGIATLYGQEKVRVGYCGEGHASDKIAGVEVPESLDFLRPTCEPCPPHAICGPNFKTVCEPDFILTSHPWSINGILPIPLPPTCEPDSVKARKVEQVKTRAIEELRLQNADYECGELPSGASPEVEERELKTRVSRSKRASMGDREFEELWASAIGEVRSAEEVVVVGGDGSALRSTSLIRLPLACAIRRSLREALREYLWTLITLLSILSTAFYGRHYITSTRATDAKTRRLAAITLDRLSEQAALHQASPGVYGEGFLEVGKLRDDVLRNEWSTWGRRKLWEEVSRKVERNANVRAAVREGRSGDVGRVWEWTGAVGAIEDGGSGGGGLGGRRRSGRVSFAPDGDGDGDGSEIERWREGGGGYY